MTGGKLRPIGALKLKWCCHVLACTSALAVFTALPVASIAAQKQGGGAFSQSKKTKKDTRKVRKKRKSVTKPARKQRRQAKQTSGGGARNADGTYRVVANLLSNNTGETCYSTSLNIKIRNGRGRYQIGFGPLLGARVAGNRFQISPLRVSKYFKRRWSGGAGVPRRRGSSAGGSLLAVDPRGKTCKWSLRVTRM